VAIFQHSLPFLQSESFQAHVGTVHRRAIGPLAHHNGNYAYSPSLTCTSPDGLHRPRYKVTCFSRFSQYELSLPTKRSPSPNTHARLHSNDLSNHSGHVSRIPNTIETPVYFFESNNAACLHCYPPMTLRPSSIVALLRKRNNIVLSHCYA
jgi:hypothetical protein